MNIDWFTLTAQVVNFLILLALLKHFLFGPLREIMDKREETVTGRLEEARIKLDEAEEKSKRYQQKLDELERNKNEMISQARKEAEEHKKELLQQAREEVNRIQAKWEESIQNEKEIFYGELHRQTSTGIIELLDHIIRELADSTLEEQAVNKFINHLDDLDNKEKKRAIQAALDYGDGEMTVISSFPLSDRQKEQLEKKLREVFLVDISCSFEVSSIVGFGVELWADSWKIGWNVKMYLDNLRNKIEDIFDPDIEVMDKANV